MKQCGMQTSFCAFILLHFILFTFTLNFNKFLKLKRELALCNYTAGIFGQLTTGSPTEVFISVLPLPGSTTHEDDSQNIFHSIFIHTYIQSMFVTNT
jgi:hypothetical protein